MVALPGQLFYSTQIPVCLWSLVKENRELGFNACKAKLTPYHSAF
jgi:type I restriction-modification system DNA methylase subunit